MDQMPLFGRRCWAVGSSMCRLCEAIPVRTHGWWRPALHGSTFRQSRLPCPISMASRPVKLLTREPKPHGASGSGPRNWGIWSGEPMPAGLVDAMHAVEVALERSQFAGVVELVWDGDVWLEVPMVELDAPQGTVGIAHPGTCWLRDAAGMVGPIGTTVLAGSFPHRPMPTHPSGRAPSGLPATE